MSLEDEKDKSVRVHFQVKFGGILVAKAIAVIMWF